MAVSECIQFALLKEIVCVKALIIDSKVAFKELLLTEAKEDLLDRTDPCHLLRNRLLLGHLTRLLLCS